MAKQPSQPGYRRIVAKFGTNLLTAGTDTLDIAAMTALVAQVVRLSDEGREVLIVSRAPSRRGANAWVRAAGDATSRTDRCWRRWGRRT